MKRILIVFGTRPEAIKMAPLVNEFKQYPEEFNVKVCVTGQHRQMLDQVLNLFNIIPDYDLNIMKHEQDLYDITSNVLLGIREIIKQVNPEIIFVHGDTTTSTATALSAYYQQIPVAHIEAGLRTYDMYSPWPEEINRQITGRIATYHFAPTTLAKTNLLEENVSENRIILTGNTVIDALQWVTAKIENSPHIEEDVVNNLLLMGYDVSRLNPNKRMILITGHRRENFGEGFINICDAIKELTIKFPNVDFVYPMHLNPNVRKPINEIFRDIQSKKIKDSNVFFIEPLDYLPFVYLMNKSYLVLTDSGGIQEEAPGLGKPVLVMRDTTERQEALQAGTVKLVGTDKYKIVNEVTELLESSQSYNKMAHADNPYGDGKASKRIVEYFKS